MKSFRKKTSSIYICIIPRFDILDKIRTVLHNNWGVEAYGISIDPRDTIFKYQLMTDQKINKRELMALKNYCAGFVAALE